MAEQSGSFDANVPAMQDSNWLFYAKAGSEQPKGSSSNKIVGDAVGKSMETGLKLADSLVEDHVRDTVFDVEQKNRMQFINESDQLASDKGVQRPNILDAGTQKQSLDTAPPAVKQAVQKVQTVTAAADSGKLDKYGYYQRVIPELQAVRQQYPGYRHVVDQALGSNANAYMTTLIQEINRKDSEHREDARRFQSEALSMWKEGLLGPHGEVAVQGVMSGKVDQGTFLKYAAPFVAQNYEAKAAQRNKEIHEWSTIQQTESLTTDANKQAKSIAAGAAIWPAVAGGQAGPTSTDDMNAIKGMINTNKIDPVEMTARARRIEMHQQEAYSAFTTWANTPYANGRTPMDMLGKEKIEGIWQAQSAPMKAFLELVGDPKTYAAAEAVKNNIAYTNNNDVWAAMNDPQSAQFMRNLHVLKTGMGDQAVTLAVPYLDIPGNAKAIMSRHEVNIYGGLPDKNGNPPTIGDQTAEMKDKGIAIPAAYQGKVDMVHKITDKDTSPEYQKKVAQAFFAPTKGNRDFIANFNSSYYGQDGRWHNGAEDIFKTITDPKITKQIIKFGDADLTKNYQDTVDTWFRTLNQRNITTLNGALQEATGPQTVNRATGQRTGKGSPEIKLTWDSDSNQIDVTPETRKYLTMTRQRGVLDSVSRLQKLTGNMGDIINTVQAEGYPRDMRTYMLRLLQEEGLDIKDLPATKSIQKAIEATAPKPKPAEDKLGAM